MNIPTFRDEVRSRVYMFAFFSFLFGVFGTLTIALRSNFGIGLAVSVLFGLLLWRSLDKLLDKLPENL